MIDNLNDISPCQKSQGKLISNFWINMFFLTITLILSFLYIISILGYITKNYGRKTLLTYWFDYILLTMFALLYLLFYFIQQIHFFIIQMAPKPQCYYCIEHIDCYLVYFSVVFVLLLSFNNIIFDMIKGLMLIQRIHKVSLIQTQDKDELFAIIQSQDNKKIINKNFHKKELIIAVIVYGIVTTLYIVIFMLKQIDSYSIHLFVSIMTYCIMLIIISFIAMFFFLKHYKAKLLENNYYSINLIMQRVYNTNSSRLVYFCDFITYKSIIDCIGNIPLLLFLCVGYYHLVPMILTYLSIFLYVYYSGSIFIYMDKPNRTKKSWLLRGLFCLNKHNVNFGEREREQLFQEFNFDYSDGEIAIMNRLDVDLSIINNRNNDKELIPTITRSNSGLIIYFFICKLIYLFFQKNESIYTATQKKMDEEAFGINTLINKTRENTSNNFIINAKDHTSNKFFENRKSRIDRISRLSKINQDSSIIPSLKFGLSSLINTLQEKDFKKAFKRKYKAQLEKLSNNFDEKNIEFKIESLFSKSLIHIFPFYQMTIKDLLKSVDPTNNKTLFMQFTDSIEKDSLYNEFYTNDSFLSFEIYEQSFISYELLKEFFDLYEQYLFDVIKNFKYTYLPLIIGVYSISYLDFHKIIVLYRNGLSFTSFLKLNHWIKFSITEAPEESSVSQKHNDVIDLNEIEIKNNIKLNQEDYNEVAENLANDINFIKSLPFKVFPKITLFVGNQINSMQTSIYDSQNESIHIEKEDSKAFGSFMRDTIHFGDNQVIQQKEFGSEIESLFERVYEINGNEGRFSIKIFFSLLFRGNCVLNLRETNQKYKLESGYYCDQ